MSRSYKCLRFLLLTIDQYKYTRRLLTCFTSVENCISVETFKSSNTGLVTITLNASFGDIQLLRYHKMTKIWTPPLHLFVLIKLWFYSFIATCCNQPQQIPQKKFPWMFFSFTQIQMMLLISRHGFQIFV